MAGGAGAGADGGAGGGGGGGDGRGPSGGSTSSGGRSLQGECPSVSLRLGAEAVPGAALGVPARKGLSLVVRGPCCGPGRRRRRWTAAREGAVVRPGGEATSAADWPVPVHPEGRARPGAAVPGAEARGVALGGRGGPSGSGLRARRGGTRRSQDSGKPLPRLGRVFTGLRGCGRPGVDGRAASRN